MYKAAILTVSDKGARGEREDKSGPVIEEILKDHGYETVKKEIVPDEKEEIKNRLKEYSDEDGLDLIITTGGTGFAKRDITPEATAEVMEKDAPGIAQAMTAASLKVTPMGMLSRAKSVIRGKSLIINLPGSPKACRENLEAVIGSLSHGIDVLKGDFTEHKAHH